MKAFWILLLLVFLMGAVSLFVACGDDDDDDDDSSSGDDDDSASDDDDDSAECETLNFSDFDQDTVLDKECYLIPDRMAIENGVTVTIKPGVVLYFGQSKHLFIRNTGSLLAEGTANNPVVFTGQEKTPGYWGGIWFDENEVPSKLGHVVVEYAGYETGTDAALNVRGEGICNSDGLRAANVLITNSKVSNNHSYGLHVDTCANIEGFSNNVITENSSGPLYISGNSVQFLDKETTYTGNDLDLISVLSPVGDRGQNPILWPMLEVPYLIDGTFKVYTKLEIEAGTTIVMKENSGIYITEPDPGLSGALVAVGTDNEPITFTGESKVKGAWCGITFLSAPSGDNILRNTIVEYGGSTNTDCGNVFGQWPESRSNIKIAAPSANSSVYAVVKDSIIRESASWGIFIGDSHTTVNNDIETSNTFENNELGDVHYE